MENKQYLNYDPETNQLYICDDCETNPVYTKTSFNESDLFVKEDCLWMRDLNGIEYKLSGSLRGKDGKDGSKGDQGPQGIPGESASTPYHLELSNDMDQVYVNENNIVSVDQKVQTIANLYRGDEVVPLGVKDVNEGQWELLVVGDYSASIENNKIEIAFSKDNNEVIIEDRIYQIVARYVINNTPVKEVIKDFKLKVLQGNVDYDLYIRPSIIKLDTEGKSTIGKIKVKVSAKEVGLKPKQKRVRFLDVSELPEDYTVSYNWSGQEESILNASELDVQGTTEEPLIYDSSDVLSIYLKYQNEVVDVVYVECVQDGVDGITSKHIELSDDYDQLYITEGVVTTEQTYEIKCNYFEGQTRYDIDSIDHVKVEGDLADYLTKSINNGEVVLTFTIPENILFSYSTAKAIIEYEGARKVFTLAVIEGQYDYDLWVSPDYITTTVDSENNINYGNQTIDIKISQKSIGAHTSEKQFITIPEEFILSYNCDDGSEVVLTDAIVEEGEDPYYRINLEDLLKEDSDNKLKKITISLTKKSDSTLIDWSEVAVLYDGKNGEKGEKGDDGLPGASAYYIDLSNDFDQLYNQQIDGVKTLLPNQSFNTQIRLYKGSQLYVIPTTATLTCSKDSGSILGITCSISESGIGSVVINFSQPNADDEEVTYAEITSADLEQTSIAYKISLSGTIDGEAIELHKTIRVANITGTEDFDLKCNVTTIAKDSSGNLHDTRELPTFSVKCKNLLGSSASVVTYDTLSDISDAGLTLKYIIDGTTPENATDYGELSGIQVSPDILNRTKEYLKVSLYKDGREIDYILLDVVQDGKNATLYYTELSNDLDQVYVNGNKYITTESIPVSTIVSLYKGAEQIPITTSDVIVSLTGELNDNQYVQLEKEQLNNSVKITITFTQGARLSQKGYVIPITVNKEEAAIMSKQFMIKVFTGNESYDLNIQDSVIYVSPTGVCTPSSLTFSVDKTTYGESAETVSNAPLPQGWLVMHQFDNGQTQAVSQNTSDNTFSITLPPNASNTKVLKIWLNKNSEIVDAETIQFVRDGKDGEDGEPGPPGVAGITLQATVDKPTVYLNSNGKALQQDQTVTVSFQASNEGTISDLVISTTDSSLAGTVSEDGLSWSKTFNHDGNNTYPTGVQTYTVSATVTLTDWTTQIVSTQFSINIVTGITTYDLKASPAYIKYNPNDKSFEDIEFTVYSEISGGGYFEETELNWNDTSVSLYVGGNDDTLLGGTKNGPIWSWTPDIATSTTIKLKEEGGDLKDFIILPVVRDGEIKTEIAQEFLVEGTGDKANTVVAGLTKDPVFFWGGGTKSEAQNKQTSLYFTTDGTGKVGVFNIHESEVTIESDFLDVTFSENPPSNNPSQEFYSKSGITLTSYNSTTNGGSYNIQLEDTIAQPSQNLLVRGELTFTKPTITGTQQYGLEDYENGETPNCPTGSVKITNATISFKQNGTLVGKLGGEQNNGTGWRFTGSQYAVSNSSWTNDNTTETGEDQTLILQSNGNSDGVFRGLNTTIPIQIEISFNVEYGLDAGLPEDIKYAITNVSNITPTLSLCIQEPPKIYIGKSGISMSGAKFNFTLQPNMTGININVSGLPTNNDFGNLSAGDMYVDNGALKIKT